MNTEQIDLIDRYCRGTLSEIDRRDFEAKINQDPNLKKQVLLHADLIEGIQRHFNGELKSMLKQSDKPDNEKKNNRKYFFYSLAVAATVSLFLVLGYVLMNNASPTRLYQAHYQAYPNIVNPVERSASDDKKNYLDNAMRAYEQADYQQAASLFEQSEEPLSYSYKFYLAISYIELSRHQDALQLLREVQNSDEKAYYYPSLWYQSMSFLALSDAENTRKMLEQLSESPDSYYSNKAEEVLDEL
ncbi:tetratricopeptide (TPR) repeat protein [Catalinimonas alkaloidigena]|uniref:tetratricopeptide repeat protein n=1 Tax=Catalinimonas alkaloidigena TaxID=1075417 RepID=UPI002404E273|nr:tetratricopeptide repeat protein [Catalinimonas alkaloidigena]MDF9795928.1 tetratricopeptide (TPR) repeat protein [Catalinimonas alkaloidigena]